MAATYAWNGKYLNPETLNDGSVPAPPSAPTNRHHKEWSFADLAELDVAQLCDKDVLYQQRLAVETVDVTPKELWHLHRKQQAAHQAIQQKRPCSWHILYGRSILGLPLLAEESRAVRWWGRLMLLVDLTYTTFYIPITLVLYERYNVLMATEATVLFIVDVVFGSFFFLNLMLQLHTPVRVSCSFYQLLVQYGRGVLYLYRTKGTLWIDACTALPWFLQIVVPFLAASHPSAAQALVSTLMVLRLVRLVRVVHLVRVLAQCNLFPHSSSRLMSVGSWYLLSLVFAACATINLLACVWYATGLMRNSETWMTSMVDEGARKADLYLAAVYFTVTTITTTGYGDISAKNNLEMVVAIVIMLIGALFMSFIIGTVAAMVNGTSPTARRSQAFRSKVSHLDRFFHENQTSSALEHEVYRYYYYVWTRCQQEEEEWQEVMRDLPTGLRGRVVLGVLRHTCRQLLEQLAAGVPEAVLLVLCASLQRQVLGPGSTLAAPGSPVGCVWLLRHGSIIAVHPGALVDYQLSAALCQDAGLANAAAGAHNQKQRQQQQTCSAEPLHSAHIVNSSSSSSNRGCLAATRGAVCLQLCSRQQQAVKAPLPAEAIGPSGSSSRVQQPSSNTNSTTQAVDLEAAAAPVVYDSALQIAQDNQQQHRQQEFQEQSDQPAGTGLHSSQQRQQESALLRAFHGPCIVPSYAVQNLPSSTAAGAVSSSSTSNSGTQSSSTQNADDYMQQQQQQQQQPQQQDAQVHGVWLRTQGLCVAYRLDITVLQQLCHVCPRLGSNLRQLLWSTHV